MLPISGPSPDRRIRRFPWPGPAGTRPPRLDRVFRSPGVLRGYVVDWIKLPYFPPSFNIADSSIVIGVALLFLASIRGWQLDGRHQPSVQQPDHGAQSQDVPHP